MSSPSDETGQHAPAPDTAQIPIARDDTPPSGGGKPAHAARAGSEPGISRAGWRAITLAAAALLILGFLLTFGPARYWTPVPVVFLGYFLISGLIGLVFWKGVRELRDSNPTLHSGDGPASPGARVAAAIGAVGIASALILLPASLSNAPANAAPCPDGSQTCGPQPTIDPGPTQGNGGNTVAPQAPNTTVPGYTPPETLAPPQGNGNGNGFQGTVRPMPTPDQTDPNACILNCGPTQAPQTGQANPPRTGQNPVTTAPNMPATTPQAPTTTPQLRTPTPETTTSTTSSKARDRDDDQQRGGDEDREKNSGIPYQAAEIAALAGTYRRKKTSDAVRDGQVVAENATRTLYTNATTVSKPVQLPGPGGGGRIPDPPRDIDPSRVDPPAEVTPEEKAEEKELRRRYEDRRGDWALNSFRPKLTDEQREIYRFLRSRTPNDDAREKTRYKWELFGSFGGRNPWYHDLSIKIPVEMKDIDADHLIPVRTIVAYPGFDLLSPEAQFRITDMEENLWPVPSTINQPAIDKPKTQWPTSDKIGKFTPQLLEIAMERAAQADQAIRSEIASELSRSGKLTDAISDRLK